MSFWIESWSIRHAEKNLTPNVEEILKYEIEVKKTRFFHQIFAIQVKSNMSIFKANFKYAKTTKSQKYSKSVQTAQKWVLFCL